MKGNLLIALTGFLPAQTLLAEVKTDTVKFAANIDSIRHANPSVFQATSRHSNLDSLKAEVKRQLESRYGQHYGCASLSLTAICATLGGTTYSERQLRGLSDSFSGGIGHTFSEGTCGALSGAIMALGMYASGDKKLHQKMAAEVFEALKKQEGTVKCGDIYGKYHFDHCDGCNLCAIQKVIEVLWNNGDIEISTANPWEIPSVLDDNQVIERKG